MKPDTDELFDFGVTLMKTQTRQLKGEIGMKTETKESIDQYIKNGYIPGDFLLAVLANNLVQALHRADEDNSRDLREIIRYIGERAPAACWGSQQAVCRWMKLGGMRGLTEVATQ
jgi:hypothetical protein